MSNNLFTTSVFAICASECAWCLHLGSNAGLVFAAAWTFFAGFCRVIQ